MSATVAVRERPILFSGPMVRAILDGRKSQTRRVVKPQPLHRVVEPRVGLTIGMDPADDGSIWYDADGVHPGREMRCPCGRIGDRLWVRESLSVVSEGLEYAADGALLDMTDEAWELWNRRAPEDGPDVRSVVNIPSIHMPWWASRLTLEITDVRVERVREISEDDARAEGVAEFGGQLAGVYAAGDHLSGVSAVGAFARLWDKINAPRGFDWEANPWCWCVSFRRVEAA